MYFQNDCITWIQIKLTAPDGSAGDLLGRSVAISEDQIIVGSCGDDDKLCICIWK